MQKKRKNLRLVLGLGAALAALGLPQGAAAHGVGWRGSSLSAVPLEFLYSTGEPMSYREARVFSPADERFAAQSGRTDAAGRLAFVPDVPGLWRVIVRDEEGHQATAEVEISQEFLSGARGEAAAQGGTPEGLELVIRAGLGVSLIFNAAALALLWRRRA